MPSFARFLVFAVVISATTFNVCTAQRTIGSTDVRDPALMGLLADGGKIEVLASGFTWCEGPVWVPKGGYLLFSDIPRNSIFRWDSAAGIQLFMRPSGYTGVEFYGLEPGTNGLALDGHGQLMMCEHGDRRVSVLI